MGGRLFSGMSMMVVTPPAAAARVAVAKPSHSVRPGSLTCTWVSTMPGSSTSSSARSTVRAPVRSASYGSIAAIRPPLTADGGRSLAGRGDHPAPAESPGRTGSRRVTSW